MPEGDTVYRAARLLDRSLSGQVLTRTDFRVPQHATADLSGATVVETVSRGKHLLTRIDGGPDGEPWTLHTHLKMEGAWRVLDRGRRWPRPAHQARVVLETDRRVAVGFSLGIVELFPAPSRWTRWATSDPTCSARTGTRPRRCAASSRTPPGRSARRCSTRAGWPGIGNMYMAELCFVSGVHPRTPVGAVGGLTRLVRRGKQMLELNKERAVQSTTGDLRERQRMWVYRRDKSPCRRCGTPIRVAMVGPRRPRAGVVLVPSCQPAP